MNNFPLFLALKYLKPKRSPTSVVTVFSILGVLFGVAIMIVTRAIMTGFGDMWHEKILAFKPHITLTANTRATGARVITGEEELREVIGAVPGVTAVSPAVETRVLVEHGQNILAPIVIGLDPGAASGMIPFNTISMRAGEFDLEGDAIVVGSVFASLLGIQVGSKILVYSPMNIVRKDEIYFPEELVVTGIFQTGQTQFDSDFAIVSLPLARDLVGLERGVYSLHVKTRDPRDPGGFDLVCARVRAAAGGPGRYDLATWREIDRELFDALAFEKNMMSLLLAFITIVAIFCVTNTIIVTTVQKTGEIGLLKALGFSTGKICLTFVLYGLVQCVIGILLGVGAALLVLRNLNNILEFLRRFNPGIFSPSIYGLNQLPWRVTPSEILHVSLTVLLCCAAVGTFFAWRAARLDPIAALRKE